MWDPMYLPRKTPRVYALRFTGDNGSELSGLLYRRGNGDSQIVVTSTGVRLHPHRGVHEMKVGEYLVVDADGRASALSAEDFDEEYTAH